MSRCFAVVVVVILARPESPHRPLLLSVLALPPTPRGHIDQSRSASPSDAAENPGLAKRSCLPHHTCHRPSRSLRIWAATPLENTSKIACQAPKLLFSDVIPLLSKAYASHFVGVVTPSHPVQLKKNISPGHPAGAWLLHLLVKETRIPGIPGPDLSGIV